MPRLRSLVVLVCVAALLGAALTPGVSASLWTVLVPLGPLFGLVLARRLQPTRDLPVAPFPFIGSVTSRPPPIS